MMRRFGLAAMIGGLTLTGAALAQPPRGGGGRPDDEVRRIEAALDKLRGEVKQLERRLDEAKERARSASSRRGPGFSREGFGPPTRDQRGRGAPGMPPGGRGFGEFRGMGGQFGGGFPGRGSGAFPGGPGGFGGGFGGGSSRGGDRNAEIERKLDRLAQELDSMRRELRGLRR